MHKRKVLTELSSRALLLWWVLFVASVVTPFPAHADPNQGPGGPILVITSNSPSARFGTYYAEILRTEGFNEFAVAEIGSINAATLDNYDVAILASAPLSGGQVTMLTNWVTAGGNLVAMRPDPQLAGLLGVEFEAGTLSNGYLRVDTSTRAGRGIESGTMQFHGDSALVNLADAERLATLYSTASAATPHAAVTTRNVGANGGQAAAFAFDLATSIVYTRQGNPDWAGQERDGFSPLRSDDLFFGPASFDPQPNWIDFNKVDTPQADEQQRFLANLITEMTLDRKPLPRFWYLPHGHLAAVMLTGDEHGGSGWTSSFDQLAALSAPACSLTNWECYRGTVYTYSNTPVSPSQAAGYVSNGFEVALHVNPACGNYVGSPGTELEFAL